MNTRENDALAMPANAPMMAAMAITMVGPTAPLSRERANETTLAGLPPSSNDSPGSKHSAMPVNERSNSSSDTRIEPRAGSLR